MNMTSFALKLLAIVFMVVDHLGYYFFPDIQEFRIIGRLSFPLFAWMIANGFIHTHNPKSYLTRLVLFAFISQIPYNLVNSGGLELNIFFTLATGLFCLIYIKAHKFRAIPIVFILAFLAEKLEFNYGAYGVFTIIIFYLFYSRPLLAALTLIFNTMIFYVFVRYPNVPVSHALQFFAPVSVIFIYFCNEKQGPRYKYLFYIFYPLHLFIIYLVKLLIN